MVLDIIFKCASLALIPELYLYACLSHVELRKLNKYNLMIGTYQFIFTVFLKIRFQKYVLLKLRVTRVFAEILEVTNL